METADARMDLVRQSAQAMERRVSDTVEVLLSLLKYFRSRGDGDPIIRAPALASTTVTVAATSASRPRLGDHRERRTRSPASSACSSRGPLPAIQESIVDGASTFAASQGPPAPPSSQEPQQVEGGGADGPYAVANSRGETSTGTESGAESASVSACADSAGANAGSEQDTESGCESGTASPKSAMPITNLSTQASTSCTDTRYVDPAVSAHRQIVERHPLFATRLCYQTEGFFWSWASASDFRSELDALRSWRRAYTSKRPAGATANAGPPRSHGAHDGASSTATEIREATAAPGDSVNQNSGGVGSLDASRPSSESSARVMDDLYPNPTEVFIDLSVLSLASTTDSPIVSEREHSSQGERRHRRVRRRRSSRSSSRSADMVFNLGASDECEGEDFVQM